MEIKIWVLFDLFDSFSHKLAILNLTVTAMVAQSLERWTVER